MHQKHVKKSFTKCSDATELKHSRIFKQLIFTRMPVTFLHWDFLSMSLHCSELEQPPQAGSVSNWFLRSANKERKKKASFQTLWNFFQLLICKRRKNYGYFFSAYYYEQRISVLATKNEQTTPLSEVREINSQHLLVTWFSLSPTSRIGPRKAQSWI